VIEVPPIALQVDAIPSFASVPLDSAPHPEATAFSDLLRAANDALDLKLLKLI
jgi:hypothetical protein